MKNEEYDKLMKAISYKELDFVLTFEAIKDIQYFKSDEHNYAKGVIAGIKLMRKAYDKELNKIVFSGPGECT